MPRQTILITGASGFIGTALISRLKTRYCILGLDKVLHKDRDGSVLWYKADISDNGQLKNIFSEIKENISVDIDYVFHLAAYYDMSNNENTQYLETNQNGIRYLLDSLIDFNVKNFFFTSSAAVFEPTINDHVLNETSALSSFTYYGKSKIAGERILSEYKERIKISIFRLSAVYSHTCGCIVLANQIAFVWRKCFGCRILPGKADGGLSYIHIEDILDAFEKAMLKTKSIVSGSIFILSEDDYVSNKELYGLIFNEIYGKRPYLIHLPVWVVKFYISIANRTYSLLGKNYFFKPWMLDLTNKKYHFNINKAKSTLQWHPQFRLKEYMGVIINNLKNDTHRWLTVNNIK